MAALDFPATPTNGQVFTSNGSSWTYDSAKVAWRSSPYEPGAAITSATAPTNPQNGDIWFDTDDGTMYVYYNDGTSSQWTEMRSQIATSQVGLIPIVPSSISVGSGTGTVTGLGNVNYTGVSSISLNSIFSSSYTHYRVIVQHELTANTSINMRLRASGSDNSSAVYNNSHVYWGTAGNGANIINNSTLFGGLFGHAIQRGAYELYNPQVASRTVMTFFGAAENTTAQTEQHTSSAVFKGNNQFDGFTLFPTSGTMTGSLQVYAYND